VWRSRLEQFAAKPARPDKLQPNVRLRDIPSPGELQALPADRLRLLVAALFEVHGYTATVRTNDPDIDVELRLRGHPKPSVLVCCRPGSAGPIGAKAVREFFGSLVAASVDAGWIVAAGGFAEDAPAAATERGIELIDGEGLIDRLRQLPSADLGQVLSKAGA
jgi:restriction endonuclease Mrr